MSDLPRITAAELAARLGGRLDGDGQRVVCGVATLEEAGPDDLTWVASPELLPRLAESRAGVVIAPEGCQVPGRGAAIHVSDPDMAISTALEALAPKEVPVPTGVDSGARVASDAVVDGACIAPHVFVGAGAVIGPGTQLYPGAYIGSDCRIGRDCVLWPNVVVRERCTLGDRVIVHPNSTIGADGFGYNQRGGKHHKIPQIGVVVVEDDVEIGANVCIDRARSGQTRIGRGTKIDNLVQIAHNVCIGEDCIVVSQCGISGSTTLGRHVILAGQVGLIDHLKLGDNVVVAAKSGVSRDVPAGQVYRGIPAVENSEFGRQAVLVRRLPKLVEQLRALSKRVEQLESAADDTTRG